MLIEKVVIRLQVTKINIVYLINVNEIFVNIYPAFVKRTFSIHKSECSKNNVYL